MKNITDFLNQITPYKNTIATHPNFLYRGQSVKERTLLPSFSRIANGRNLSRKQALQLEREAMFNFVMSARSAIDLRQSIDIVQGAVFDFFGWQIIMQHYNAPSRSLDWSTSPLVALYFSCLGHPDKDGKVWIVDFKRAEQNAFEKIQAFRESVLTSAGIDDQIKAFYQEANVTELFNQLCQLESAPDIIQLLVAVKTNERIEAQQGRFSISTNPLTDHLDVFKAQECITELIVPASSKLSLLEELYVMNINARTLFPGIDGIGRSISEFCKLWDVNSMVRDA